MRITYKIINIDLVSEYTTNTAEALAELVTLGALIRDQLNRNTVLLVIQQNPVSERFNRNDLKFSSCFRVNRILRVFSLSLSQHMDARLALDRVVDLVS